MVLYHADCRAVLPTLCTTEAFAFTSPPFNTGKNYGTWNDNLPVPQYLEFCREWIAALRAVAPTMCVYHPMIHMLDYWNMLGRDFKQIAITWAPGGAVRLGWVNIFVSMLSNATPTRLIPDNWHNVQTRGLGEAFKEWDQGHPGYTSEDITGRVLDGLCPEGALVVEPFVGSGTTLLCAKQRRMHVIGCEVDEAWCEKAARRCSQPAPAVRVPNLWEVSPL